MIIESGEHGQRIPWPEGIKSEDLEFLLKENRQEGRRLRKVVVEQLEREAKDLERETYSPEKKFFGTEAKHTIDGFYHLAVNLDTVFDFAVNKGKIAKIVNELSVLSTRFEVQDNLTFLAESIRQLESYKPFIEGLDKKPSDWIKALADLMEQVSILERDPKGFKLADFLAEQTPISSTTTLAFQQEKLGRQQAAKRYKELYNLLIQHGATPDRN